jgi:hypothetical protein
MKSKAVSGNVNRKDSLLKYKIEIQKEQDNGGRLKKRTSFLEVNEREHSGNSSNLLAPCSSEDRVPSWRHESNKTGLSKESLNHSNNSK